MAIHKATLAKEIDSTIEYIYPKTTSDIVEYTSGISVYDKLSEIVEVIDTLDTNLDTINDNISALATNVSNNATSITNLTTTMDSHTGSISTLEDKNTEVYYYFNAQNYDRINADATSTIHGECNIIKAYGKVIMIDTGGYNRSDDIEAYLTEIGVTKVDYLIISHWHMDHCSNFSNGLMDYLDWSDCVCYFPVDVPSWMLDYSSATTYKANAVAYAEANCAQIIYPEEYDELVLNDYFKITFYNCGSTYLDEIKSLQDDIEECVGHYTSWYTNQYYMNDSSMVCLVNHMGIKVLYSGDIMKAAQQRIYKAGFTNDVDLYKMHHHGCNASNENQQLVNYLYCRMINPKDVIIENSSQLYKIPNPTTYDILFFNQSNCYHALDSHIVYVSANGSITHVTEDAKLSHNNTLSEYSYTVFIDWTQQESINKTSDGSYWNPFRFQTHAVKWLVNQQEQGFLSNVILNCVVFEGDMADSGAVSTNLTSYQNSTVYIRSYDYFKGNIDTSVDSDGKLSDEAKSYISKYICRGTIIVGQKSNLRIYGIRIAPNDAFASNSFISSASVQSEAGLASSNNAFIGMARADSNVYISRCIIDLDEVTSDTMSNLLYKVSFFALASNATLKMYGCYVSNLYNIVRTIADGCTVDLGHLEVYKTVKLAQVYTSYNDRVHFILGSWLLNLELGSPDYFNCEDMLTLTYGCHVDIYGDTSSSTSYTYNGTSMTGYELIKAIKYPIQYRVNSDPIIINGNALNSGSTYLYEFQTCNTSTAKWYDAYGARTDLAQLGVNSLTGGILITELTEISEDYYDFDNIKFAGCWSVIGTGLLQSFSNIPPTLNNGKLVCEAIGCGTSYYRQTYSDWYGRRFERIYSSSNGWSSWITVNGAMYGNYTDNGGYLLAITAQPTNTSASNGDEVTLSVGAIASSTLKYDWYSRSGGTGSFSQAGVQESSITITVGSSNIELCCVVSDSTGHSITSNIATISIS